MARTKSTQVFTDKLVTSKGKGSMADLLASTGYNIPTLKRGQEVTGKVISASRSEILIDVGAKSEGIVYGREISAAGDILTKLAPGDLIEATVIYPENEQGQVVLSLRKLSGTKRWNELEEKKDTGETVEVVAMEANRGGVLCEYFGLRGFLPASQLSQQPSKLGDLIGKRLTVGIIEADRATNRLIFTQKQPDKKDMEELTRLLGKVNVGEKYTGVVSAILPFGIFVEINLKKAEKGKEESKEVEASESKDKIEGLVHISEISWDKMDEPTKLFVVGQKQEVVVIAKDLETGRLNLSIKQLSEDPFVEVSKQYTKEQKVHGKVSKVTPFGVFVNLESGLEGLMHISKIPPNVAFEAGQEIDCEIESIDSDAKRISLVPLVTEKPILYR